MFLRVETTIAEAGRTCSGPYWQILCFCSCYFLRIFSFTRGVFSFRAQEDLVMFSHLTRAHHFHVHFICV